MLTIASAWTTLLAMQLAVYGMTQNRPEGKAGCVTGVAVFILIGGILTILTFILGMYFTYRNSQYIRMKNLKLN